jgi:hypothetical protein
MHPTVPNQSHDSIGDDYAGHGEELGCASRPDGPPGRARSRKCGPLGAATIGPDHAHVSRRVPSARREMRANGRFSRPGRGRRAPRYDARGRSSMEAACRGGRSSQQKPVAALRCVCYIIPAIGDHRPCRNGCHCNHYLGDKFEPRETRSGNRRRYSGSARNVEPFGPICARISLHCAAISGTTRHRPDVIDKSEDNFSNK